MAIQDVLIDSNVVAASLHNLRPANVSFCHSFNLTDAIPIYRTARRILIKHKEVVRADINKMLLAKILVLASSALSFSVGIAAKKDGKPRFCVD